MGVIDEIAPSYMGEQRIDLQLDPETSLSPKALEVIAILVDVSRTLPAGLVLPLEVEVLAPSQANYQRRYIRRTVPDVLTVRLEEGGRHTVRISEVGHNRWYGELTFDVRGDTTS